MAGSLLAATALAEELPDARVLIERHIEAIGGREMVLAQADSLLLGTFAMPAAGVSGSLTVASRASGDRVTRIELPGMGEIHSGYGPEVSWSIDPFMGPRLIEGDELTAMIERSEPAAILREDKFVLQARTIERTEFAGQACYRVELTWRSGRTTHDCYSVDSGLMIAMEAIETSPMGEVESLTLLEEYQEIHGALVPTVTTVRVMGQDQVLTFEDFQLGPPDEAWFVMPPAIRTLLDDA
jgi:hypothetical protein